MTAVSGALGTGRSTGGPANGASSFRCLIRRHRAIAHVFPLAPQRLLGTDGSLWPVRSHNIMGCSESHQSNFFSSVLGDLGVLTAV